MKKCAYCGSGGTLTKEHVWPKSLIEKYDGMKAYNKENNKFHGGEAVIKDVCKECNNVHLSKLDEYISELYNEHFFEIIRAGDSAFFNYDYELLLRALLKISYNSARAAKSLKIAKAHEKLSSYILDGGYRGNIMLRLLVVTESKAINLSAGTDSQFRPECYRCADIAYDGALSNRFMVRLIAINSFWFYIIFPFKKEPEHKWRTFIDGFTSWKIQPGFIIDKKDNKAFIPANETTYMHSALLGSLLDAKYNA